MTRLGAAQAVQRAVHLGGIRLSVHEPKPCAVTLGQRLLVRPELHEGPIEPGPFEVSQRLRFRRAEPALGDPPGTTHGPDLLQVHPQAGPSSDGDRVEGARVAHRKGMGHRSGCAGYEHRLAPGCRDDRH